MGNIYRDNVLIGEVLAFECTDAIPAVIEYQALHYETDLGAGCSTYQEAVEFVNEEHDDFITRLSGQLHDAEKEVVRIKNIIKKYVKET